MKSAFAAAAVLCAAALAAAPPAAGASATAVQAAGPTSAAGATTGTRDEPAGARPRVALVLSGGGARGGAHIGVLKVLERLRVPVDLIVGTSAGAIVGAAYASGLPLDSIEREMKRLSTATLFRDLSRDDMPYRRKVDDNLNLIGPEIGIGRDGVALPKGAVAGVALEAVLRRLTERQASEDFDRLPIPFRAIATDLASSEMVVLRRGSLSRAIRASMAIPGAVNPEEIDGRLLVDGGLKRNLPVDVARALGAERIIAVNIGTPLLSRREITSVVSVADQMLRILTEANVEKSLAELRPTDILIAPDLGTLSSADFDRLSEAAAVGEAAAASLADRLRPLALDELAYAQRVLARTGAREPRDVTVSAIRIEGARTVNPEVVAGAMEQTAGARFDPAVVEADMKRVFGRGDFESVDYALSGDGGGAREMTVQVSEKSWGPSYLRFGLGLSSDFEGNALFDVRASHRLTWLNPLGGEWRNDVQIGFADRLRSEWYQPLTARQRFFVAPRVEAAHEAFDVYEGGSRRIRLRRATYTVGIDLGQPLANSGEWRLGVLRGRVRFDDDTALVPIAQLVPPADIGGVLARVGIDRLDNTRFPRSGYALETRLYFSRQRFGASDDYTKAFIALDGARSSGPHTLRAGMRAGGSTGGRRLPAYELFSLGGFQQLSGFQTNQFLGDAVSFGRLVYNYRLTTPGLFDGAHVGASIEAGRIGESAFGSSRSRLRRGASIYVAFDTPIGPIYLALGQGDGGSRAAYFFLGPP